MAINLDAAAAFGLPNMLSKLIPNFSVDVDGERIPYKDPDQAERDMAAPRKAGLK